MDLIPNEPLKDKLLRNGFRLYFFQFLVAPAGYLIKMMVSRELSVEDIGLFYSIMGLIGIISVYNDLGLTEALQYYLPHYFIDKEYSKAKTIIIFTWLVQFISGILVAGILRI
jgi:O-antigen/teichoic acid export membrane protein